jgi:hypothetical protein
MLAHFYPYVHKFSLDYTYGHMYSGFMITTATKQVNHGKVLAFSSRPAPIRPVCPRNGYGAPVTHVFGLAISGRTRPERPMPEFRRGAVTEIRHE